MGKYIPGNSTVEPLNVITPKQEQPYNLLTYIHSLGLKVTLVHKLTWKFNTPVP